MIQVSDRGSGRCVVLLHGLPSPPAEMTALGDALVGHRALVPTLPGYSGTAPLPGRQTVIEVEEMLLAALRSRGVDEVDLVGFSMGAYRALSLALSRRVRVGALVLLAPLVAFSAAEREGLRGFASALRAGADLTSVAAPRFLSKSGATVPERARAVEAWLSLAPPLVLAEELDDVAAAPDLLEACERLDCKVTVRVGSEDAVCTRAHAEAIAAKAHDAVLEIVEGAGHALLVEDFEESARSVARALSRR